MPQSLAELLEKTIAVELPHLRALEGSQTNDGKWNANEELGHLIDSAANNHIRFVRAALEGEYSGPVYAQDEWVAIHGYREMPWASLVDLWFGYNSLLARVVARIPEDKLKARMFIGDGAEVTLRFVIEDYVLHMRHHIDHLLGRAA